MEGTMDLQFDILCRACMHGLTEVDDMPVASKPLYIEQPSRERNFQSIFDVVAEFEALSISELLTSIIPQIKVQLSDELPKNICSGCLENLLGAYRFQQMCLQSDQQMRELVANRNMDLYMITKEKPFQIQEPLLDDGEQDLTAETRSQASNDPLQSNDAATAEHCKMTQVDVNEYLKMEIDADDFVVGSIADHQDNVITKFTGEVKVSRVRGSNTAGEECTATSDASHSNAEHSDWENDVTKKNKKVKKSRQTKKTALKAKAVDKLPKEQEVGAASSTHNCMLCQKSFNARRYLLKHLRRHKKWDELKNMPAKPDPSAHLRFKCDICEHIYNKPESLFKHRLSHDNDNENVVNKQYTCNLCAKVYGTQRTLTRHKRQRHRVTTENEQEASKLYTCKFCNKSFHQVGTLKDHQRIHTGEQPYLCSECGKAFNSSSNMKQHLLRHGNVKRYECPDCPKKFPCLSDLASHKAVHANLKPHICDICGSGFGKPYLLKKHKMYHSGEKPHKCEYCEMRFVCMDHQRRHMRTHTGEKPYKCNYCVRAFAQSNDLIKHLRTHLGENVYRCELCPCAFRLATELRIHFALHKNDDEETREHNKKALMEEERKLRLKVASKEMQHLPVEQNSSIT